MIAFDNGMKKQIYKEKDRQWMEEHDLDQKKILRLEQ